MSTLSSTAQAVVARTWAERHSIELEAAARFTALSARLAAAGVPEALVSLARQAGQDERRHADHCQRYVLHYGGPTLPRSDRVVEYAPRSLSAEDRLTYEVVAQCCLAETLSTASLVVLLDAAGTDALREVLQELARDEVNHSKLGWAYLAWRRSSGSLEAVGEWLPGMMQGSGEGQLFGAVPPEEDDPALLAHGVIPVTRRRELYRETMEEVVLPGLDELGVTSAALRRWLDAHSE